MLMPRKPALSPENALALFQDLEASVEERARLEALPPPAGFATHPIAIVVLMASYNLRRLNWMYRTFRGDLALPLIVAEAGLHVVRQRVTADAGLPGRAEPADDDSPLGARVGDISAATGLPRETVRRKVARLVELGWLERRRGGAATPSQRTLDLFDLGRNWPVFADFLWTAARMHDLLAPARSTVSHAQARRDAIAALATRADEIPSGVLDDPRHPAVHRYAGRGREGRLALLALGGYQLRHLLRLHAAFDGDLLLPLLLGEISHHNLKAAAYAHPVTLETLDEMVVRVFIEVPPVPRYMRHPCNAHSLATVTGVPGSTVRRKVAELMDRGWVAETSEGGYVITPVPQVRFHALNIGTLNDVLATDERLRAIVVG